MKIAILGTKGIPNLYGGFEQCAELLSKQLVDKGHEVIVYNPLDHPFTSSQFNGVDIVRKWCPEKLMGPIAHIIYDFLCLCDARQRQPDIVLELGYGTSAPGLLVPGFQSLNIVINMDGLEWQRAKWGKATRWLTRLLEGVAAHRATALVADNEGIRRHLLRAHGVSATTIGYGAEVVNLTDSSTLGEFSVEETKYYLTVARLEPENNVEMVIEGYLQSAARLPLLIVGSTNTKHGQRLKARFESENILFLGPIFSKEKLDCLRTFSSIYFHGHSVGGTNPSLLEAMACGAFIAAHNNPFNRETLQSDAYCFSNAGDVTRILEQYTDNSGEKDVIGEKNKKLSLITINGSS